MNELRGAKDTGADIRVEITGSGPPGPPGPPPYIGENGNWWVGDEDTGVRAQGPKGESDHRALEHRDAADQHPIDAITGLREVVDGLPTAMTADELRKILMNGGK